MSGVDAQSREEYHRFTCHCTIEALCFRQKQNTGKSRQLCDFAVTTVQTRATDDPLWTQPACLPAYRNVGSFDLSQRLLRITVKDFGWARGQRTGRQSDKRRHGAQQTKPASRSLCQCHQDAFTLEEEPNK